MAQLCFNLRPQISPLLLPRQHALPSSLSIRQETLDVSRKLISVSRTIRCQNKSGDSKNPAVKRVSKQASKTVLKGQVTESLSNGMFRVILETGDTVIGYISGKIRKNFIRILPGDSVEVEMSVYDSTKGRIIFRMKSKD